MSEMMLPLILASAVVLVTAMVCLSALRAWNFLFLIQGPRASRLPLATLWSRLRRYLPAPSALRFAK